MKLKLRRTRAVLAVLAASVPVALVVGTAQGHDRGWPGSGGSSRVVVAGTIVSVDTASNSFVANAYITGEPRGGSGGDQGGSGGDDQGGPGDDQSGSGGDQTGSGGDQSGSGGNQGGSGGNWGDNGGQGYGGQGGSGGSGGWGDHHRHGGGTTSTTPTSTTPTTTQVTITVDSNTKFRVNRRTGTISDLAAGQKFLAVFNGDSSEDITTLVLNNPAVAVMANTPPRPNQLYAFVGTVTALSTTNGTVTVNVTNSLPSGLVPASANPATFTVGGDTLILGGASTSGLSLGSLSNVAVGDIVAGAETGPSGETLAQVQSTELRLLLDFPVGSATHAVKAKTRAQALAKAKALLGFKSKPKKHKPKKHK